MVYGGNMTTKSEITKDQRIVPVGFSKHPEFDLWLNMTFSFNRKNSEIECVRWELTDINGNLVSLSKLTYNQFKFVGDAMGEEFIAHTKKYYYDLEAEAYGLPVDRMEET